MYLYINSILYHTWYLICISRQTVNNPIALATASKDNPSGKPQRLMAAAGVSLTPTTLPTFVHVLYATATAATAAAAVGNFANILRHLLNT